MRRAFAVFFSGAFWALGCGGTPERIEHDCPIFPSDNWWNTDISGEPVDPMSSAYIASIGPQKNLHVGFGRTSGLPYAIVDDAVAKVPVAFEFAGTSDPGPYPIPPNPPIQPERAGHDRHALFLQANECRLYEIFQLYPTEVGGFRANKGVIWDLTKNEQRPAGHGSADAAGLSIFPSLVKYAEVEAGEIRHAMRFALNKTQAGYVFPATSFWGGGDNPSLPPMGVRLRLKAEVDLSGFSGNARVILEAMKRYGMILADNGGEAPSIYFDGVPDTRWNMPENAKIETILMGQFEVIETGPITKGQKAPGP